MEVSPQPVPGGTRSFAGYSTRAPPLCQRATAKFQIGSLSFHPRARTYNRSLIGCTSGPWDEKAAEKAERKVPLTVHAEQHSERLAGDGVRSRPPPLRSLGSSSPPN
ncbi:unnamed protein product [Boreogadus saida]